MENRLEKKVLAIVVTYNRSFLLEECIQNLLNSVYKCDILIVDNASTDNTQECVKKYLIHERVQYINTGSNLGGAGGFNFALKYAYQFDYDYFWLMDDDTMVDPEALSNLINVTYKTNDNFGFLSSFAKYTDGSACKMNIPTLSKKWYGDSFFIESCVKIEQATFVGFLLSKKILEKFGLPIKDFFIWADDSEFSSRIALQVPSYLVLNSTVTHKMKNNGDANFRVFMKEDSDRLDRYFYSFRNRFYIAKKRGYYQAIKFSCKLLVMAVLTLFMAKENRLKRERIIFKGFFEGLQFNPKVEFVGEKNED
ncbi:glycosyltransferase family 2 protein [Pediococcus acidilactici]|uniref:glycosyltransferase family 2 protein n=1 Tax=Pediococcus acidilactici TaxID=1254 RepID=UPI0001BEDABD|nr:glycosyltransferase family 2 protein [Pediococcus acidilactici]EFA26505.1 glycosyltransferase, group 2 family protein [Pediococcus acidilactici 7_4]MDB8870741.1 glycosyltransferase family 2 protein [Pediococcus acidilactici]MDB8878488.1 glycosyltransferase family 2 protein [Pediococcus acidilactici]QIO84965.1 glycosyltransferase [Pediococcus acidilactici]QJW86453.1 glycosyltransferase [Pediococcus acidilactici]